MGWNDFALRSYDPQTGRFLQNDPYDQFASGYVGMGNDPVNMVDPSGGNSVVTGVTAALNKATGNYNAVVTFKRATSAVINGQSAFSLTRSLASVGITGMNSVQAMGDNTNIKAPDIPTPAARPPNPQIGPAPSRTPFEQAKHDAARLKSNEEFVDGKIGYYLDDQGNIRESQVGMAIDNFSKKLEKSPVGRSAEWTFNLSGAVGAVKAVRAVAAAKTSTSLLKTGTQWSKHSLQRLAERGVTQDMAELAISKGQKFYDPLNKSINYVLPNGFASGKSLLVGTNPLTGQVTTVLRSSKNLINSRFIPIK